MRLEGRVSEMAFLGFVGALFDFGAKNVERRRFGGRAARDKGGKGVR